MDYDLGKHIGGNKFYVSREKLKNYTLEDLVMRMTSAGDFRVETIKDKNETITGVMVYY